MDRYAPQTAFLGENEQAELAKKTVAVVGLGALGSVASELLARAGIGTIILIDHDLVELSNLQRQSLYDESDIGKPKALAAKQKLQKINSTITVIAHPSHLNETNTSFLNADLVLDCTDNLETRFIINNHCKKNNLPWIHSAAAGSIGVVLPITNSYCFSCIYAHAKNALTCDGAGILNTTSFTTASLQVTEALKLLLNKNPTNALIRFNMWNNTFDVLQVKQNPTCRVCYPTNPPQKETPRKTTNDTLFTVARCKTRAAYSAKPTKNIKLNLEKIKHHFETIIDTPIALVIEENGVKIIVHSYGELIFKNYFDEEKIKQMAGEIYEVGQ